MKKRIELLPKRRSGDPKASAAAFVVQLVLIAIIVPAFLVPVAIDFLRDDSGRAVMPERISWEIMLPTQGTPQREPAREGGDGREVSDTPPSDPTPIAVPTEVPGALPTAPTTPAPEPGGSGPLIGGGGPLQGIQPSFTDQRLWVKHSDVIVAPMVPLNRADTLRMMLAERIYAMEDSLARLYPEGERRPGDWTFDLGGRKYGIDGGMIRLGRFSLPTAAIAMLPLNVQANPIAMERARRLDAMRSEIQNQALRAMRDDEFYAAVRALRERKERERREAEQQRQQQQQQGNPPGAGRP